MKDYLHSLCFLALCVLSPGLSATEAFAITVYDPTNHIQNILTALRTLQSNVNEALMIQNQIKGLANDMENLKKLEFSTIDDFSNQMNDLFEVTGSINGLMSDFNALQDEFENLYPDWSDAVGLDPKELLEKARSWLENSRNSVLGAAQTGAKVLESLPRTQAQLDSLLENSQGASGILQAAQAGNQIAGQIAGSLQALNSQLAVYQQAQMSFMMKDQAGQAAADAYFKKALKLEERKVHIKAPL